MDLERSDIEVLEDTGTLDKPRHKERHFHPAILIPAIAAGLLSFQVTLMLIGFITALILNGPTVTITGASMSPGIDRGDVVVAVKPQTDKLIPGRAVLFETDNGTVTHRIVEIDDGQYVTKGDANAQADSTLLDESDITGMARLIVPWVGWPRLWVIESQFHWLALWIIGLVALQALTRWRPVPPEERYDEPLHPTHSLDLFDTFETTTETVNATPARAIVHDTSIPEEAEPAQAGRTSGELHTTPQ